MMYPMAAISHMTFWNAFSSMKVLNVDSNAWRIGSVDASQISRHQKKVHCLFNSLIRLLAKVKCPHYWRFEKKVHRSSGRRAEINSPFWCWGRNIRGEPNQCYGYWWHGSWRGQCITSHCIVFNDKPGLSAMFIISRPISVSWNDRR